MTGLGRDMAGDAMIRDRGIVGGQRGERGAADEAVQHHRHAELARAQHRAGDGSDLAPADMAQRLEGGERGVAMKRQRAIDDGDLVRQPVAMHAGPRTGPGGRAFAEAARAQRCRRGRIADPHFTQHDQIEPRFDLRRADIERRQTMLDAHRRHDAEVLGRPVEVDRHDAQVEPGRAGQRVDGRAARLKIRNHLGGDAGWKGADALGGDAMIAGEDDRATLFEARSRKPLPSCDEDRDVLKPAERPGRLGQLPLPRRGRVPRCPVGPR